MAEYEILVPPPKRGPKTWLIVVVVVVLLAVAGGAYAIGHHNAGSGKDGRTGSGGGVLVSHPKPLSVVSTVPANGAANVASDQPVTVHVSVPLSTSSAMPTFDPPVSGTWRQTAPGVLSFLATRPFIPTSTETLLIPGGSSGLRGTNDQLLDAPANVTFTVTQASTERLQQLLAQLGYLPVTFAPAAPLRSPAQAVNTQAGSFHWRWPNQPASLTSLWTEGTEDVITKAGVMNFENQNGLTVDGLAGKEVWTALLADVASGKVNANPYTYVFVSKQLPESLTLYENGTPKFTGVPVNTGAPGADTADGTYPVFEHVVSSRMVGTNPDGSKYNDPDVPWASFFNGGDALHGFVRASYGFPQSNGCVEMSIADAAQVWPLTPIGTLVTVVGPAS
jgi:peptidoglycan hydrolase-like protein with peptidoglycan-binding domain